MCGLCGMVYKDIQDSGFLKIKNMCDSIRHRGPDGSGYVLININSLKFLEATDKEFSTANLLDNIENTELQRKARKLGWNISLGHRRLSIVDLSKKAHQPMSDPSKKIWIIFNGEVYNFKAIRTELDKYRFLSDSDTEVILYSYKKWGLDFIDRIKGMFAIAILDLEAHKLHLVRDGCGAKPLYYMGTDKFFIFGSEIKAILSVIENYELDVEAVYEYLTFQNLLTSKTFFKNIKLVPPGHIITVNLKNFKVSSYKYWDFHFHSDYSRDFEWYKKELKKALEDSIRSVSTYGDVECGSYLSGGLDTGAIISIASKYMKRMKTFTVGFDTRRSSGIERAYDEREKAEYMAWYYDTEHYEVVLKEGDLEASMNSVVWHLEEPRLGQSYPNYYAAKLAGSFVKSVLSGTGGDELLGGYPWRYFRVINATSFREFLAKFYKYWSNRVLSDSLRNSIFSMHESLPDTYEIFKSVYESSKYPLYNEHPVDLAFYFDAKVFLHGVLMIEDKYGMTFGIEARFPFLYEDFVDLAQRIPWNFKINKKWLDEIDENEIGAKEQFYIRTNFGKYILRRALEDVLPEDIVWGYKQGFSVPDSNWYRGKSIRIIQSILKNPHPLLEEILDMKSVSSIVEDHLTGRRNYRLFLWSLIYLQRFLEIFFGNYSI